MRNDDDRTLARPESRSEIRASERYERPEVVDYGTLRELTLSGTAPLSDSFGGASGGGS